LRTLLTTALFFTVVAALTGCAGLGPGGGGGGEGGSSSIIAFAPFILIFALFYFLILRPQRKQEKVRKEMLGAVKRGDSVLTSGGIYGKVVNIEDDDVTLEIAKGVNVRITRTGIASVEEKK